MWKAGVEGESTEPKGVKKKGRENLNVTMRMRSSRMNVDDQSNIHSIKKINSREIVIYTFRSIRFRKMYFLFSSFLFFISFMNVLRT